MVPGLSDVTGVSFMSYNYNGKYLRHRDFHLWVEDGNDTQSEADATFRIVPGLVQGEIIK